MTINFQNILSKTAHIFSIALIAKGVIEINISNTAFGIILIISGGLLYYIPREAFR